MIAAKNIVFHKWGNGLFIFMKKVYMYIYSLIYKTYIQSQILFYSLLLILGWGSKRNFAEERQYKKTRGYLAVGFDDFRVSDFAWVIPLLRRNGFSGTFNYIFKRRASIVDMLAVKAIKSAGMEVGNHTILHLKFPYYSPLFNGQDPLIKEGQQIPFPRNEDLRNDRGDGKNVFGKILSERVAFQSSFTINNNWGNLTDDECQQIRDFFSVYKNPKVCKVFDELSNRYLGTTGYSFSSYDGTQYTGGIFSGCRTSENHEIWERILEIEDLYAQEYFGFKMITWSMPGSDNANLYFEHDGKMFYDRQLRKPANDSGKFYSSITGNERSWTDVLLQHGYFVKHDSMYQGREDGNFSTENKHFLLFNKLFRKNLLEYPIEGTVCYRWNSCCTGITENKENYHTASDLYEAKGKGDGFDEYFITVERIRRDVARGIICGSVWDSSDAYGEKIFWKCLVDFCKKNQIQIISEAEAYRLSLENSLLSEDNMILNADFYNSLDYMKTPSQSNSPDGFTGECSCEQKEFASGKYLKIRGQAEYKVYGVKEGTYKYSAICAGTGKISFFLIKGNMAADSSISDTYLLTEIYLDSKCDKYYETNIHVEDDEAIGLLIIYNGLFVTHRNFLKIIE